MVSEKKLKALNFSVLLAEADEREGQTRPAQDFLNELKARYKAPRKH